MVQARTMEICAQKYENDDYVVRFILYIVKYFQIVNLTFNAL